MNHSSFTWKDHLIALMRMVATAIITTVLIIVGLTVGFRAQTEAADKLARDTLSANLAQACVLTLPTDPVKGRDPNDVQQCFTQYGLEAPQIVHPGDDHPEAP